MIHLENYIRRKYKVAIVSSGLGHVTRGIETWAEDLAYELRSKGIDVTLFKGGGKVNSPIEQRIYCIQRYSKLAGVLLKFAPRFGWRFGFGSPYQLEQLTFALSLIPELGRSYDIVHTQDPYVAEILRLTHKLKLTKAKVILAHGTEEPSGFLSKFDYLQQLAPYHLEKLEEQGYHGKYWCAIPNFVDVEKFKPRNSKEVREELNLPEEAFIILSVAAIKRHHKRVDWLIREVSSFKNRYPDGNILLVVAGGQTQETDEILKLGEKLLVKDVKFFINFPHQDMPKLYSAADVFVLCSLVEMMPIALLEAIASGLPAICHRYPVMEWIVGEGGDCIDMTKEGELSKTLERYYLRGELRRIKGLKARERAIQKFSKDVVVERIIDMYEAILRE